MNRIKHIVKRWSWVWIPIVVFGYLTVLAISKGLVRQTLIWGVVTLLMMVLAETDYRLRRFVEKIKRMENLLGENNDR